MPSDPGMAFVLVQHLQPQRESILARLLSSATAMTVIEVKESMPGAAGPGLRHCPQYGSHP
jgi:two-component system, chemotaxis family, CheB/CheR fusion protein